MGLKFQREKLQLIPIPAVPRQKKPKECHFCPFRHRFQPIWWDTAVFKMSCSFVNLSSSSIAELKTYIRLFENFAYGPRYRGVSAGVSRHNQKNRFVFRGRIWNLGGKILTEKNISASSRLRIWRRLWFCYQTWLNSIRWLSYGFLWHAQFALSSQNEYHTLTFCWCLCFLFCLGFSDILTHCRFSNLYKNDTAATYKGLITHLKWCSPLKRSRLTHCLPLHKYTQEHWY